MKKIKTTFQTFLGQFPENMYDIYDMADEELEATYVDQWLKGKVLLQKDHVLRDELWTVKQVDQASANHLYGEIYNPVSLNIYPVMGANWTDLFNFKATIHSRDDSSYGMWKNNLNWDEALTVRETIKEYIDQELILKGEAFLAHGKELGFDDFDWG